MSRPPQPPAQGFDMAVAVLVEEQIQARMAAPHAPWHECSRGHLHTPVTWGCVKNFRGFCYALHYNADCPPCSGWRKWRGHALGVHNPNCRWSRVTVPTLVSYMAEGCCVCSAVGCTGGSGRLEIGFPVLALISR